MMHLVSPMDFHMQFHQQMLYTQQQMTLHHHRPEEIVHPNGWLVPPSPGVGPVLPRGVKVELHNRELWQQFHAESNEMIITKNGRRMFPSIQLDITGLENRGRYSLLLEMVPASRCRHKYVGGNSENSSAGPQGARGWTSAGPAEPQPRISRRVYRHPDSPATGHHWMKHSVSFSKLKITNNAVEDHTNVVLTSMHKYVPRIWIIRCDDPSSMSNLYSQPSASFSFDETEFIAVTAYQNANITELKINNNPFAKGFRQTGQSRCKRKLSQTIEELQDEETVKEEDDENVSSSESESTRRSSESEPSRVRRALSEARSLDDSGVSSSGGTTPPLAHSPSNFNRLPSRIPEVQIENHSPSNFNRSPSRIPEVQIENRSPSNFNRSPSRIPEVQIENHSPSNFNRSPSRIPEVQIENHSPSNFNKSPSRIPEVQIENHSPSNFNRSPSRIPEVRIENRSPSNFNRSPSRIPEVRIENRSPSNFNRSPSRIPEVRMENPQPRLHRPWADSAPLRTTNEAGGSLATLPLDFPLFHPLLVPSHHQLAVMEIARLNHLQSRYQSGQPFAKYYRCQ